MKSRAAAIALAMSVLCSCDVSSAPLPIAYSGLRGSTQVPRLAIAARAVQGDEKVGKKRVEDRKGRADAKSESGKTIEKSDEREESRANTHPKNPSATATQGDDVLAEVDDRGTKRVSNSSQSSEEAMSEELAVVSGSDNETENGDDGEFPDDEEGEADDRPSRRLTTSELIAEARAHSRRLMKGGFVQFIEWLFVVILVAPGTFPVFGCVILSCANFWRRRLGLSSPSPPAPNSEALPRAVVGNVQSAYQRVPHGDHGALVARARVKGGSDEREAETP